MGYFVPTIVLFAITIALTLALCYLSFYGITIMLEHGENGQYAMGGVCILAVISVCWLYTRSNNEPPDEKSN
jgi:uncharacterized membrane protein